MEILSELNYHIWGVILLLILSITHIFSTIRTKAIQRYFLKGFCLSFKRDKSSFGVVSHFSALTLSLSATVSTGNIIGMATAIAIGGAGAVFWCWVAGMISMATKYSETLLCLKYRVKTKYGDVVGGPMYVLEYGIGQKWLAVVFSIATIVVSFSMGNMTQSNTISFLLENNFHISPHITAIVFTLLTASCLLGGIKSISSFCKKFVPFMLFFYIIFCIIIICINYHYILPTLKIILTQAFSTRAIGGGFFGTGAVLAIRYGFSRGLFCSESGFGNTPIASCTAQTKNPVRQALVSMTAVFWDTLVVSTLTGMVLVLSIFKNAIVIEDFSGSTLALNAFNVIEGIGPVTLLFGLITFAWANIFGWYYCGEKAITYLAGKKSILPFQIFWFIGLMIGCVATLDFLQTITDFFLIFMILPNIVSLFLLHNIIREETENYLFENRLDTVSSNFIPETKNPSK